MVKRLNTCDEATFQDYIAEAFGRDRSSPMPHTLEACIRSHLSGGAAHSQLGDIGRELYLALVKFGAETVPPNDDYQAMQNVTCIIGLQEAKEPRIREIAGRCTTTHGLCSKAMDCISDQLDNLPELAYHMVKHLATLFEHLEELKHLVAARALMADDHKYKTFQVPLPRVPVSDIVSLSP